MMNDEPLHIIRPPEYFPGLPFWALVLRCDTVLLGDEFQYSRQSFQNRARLRTPDGWQWITVPLKGGQQRRPIIEVEIDNTVPWRGKHFRALMYNYRSTPFFEAYEDRFEDFFARDWLTLGPLTVASIRLVAELLDLPSPGTKSDSSLATSGSRELILDSDRPVDGAVNLKFEERPYRQNFAGFEAGMSILDLFFNHGPESRTILSTIE